MSNRNPKKFTPWFKGMENPGRPGVYRRRRIDPSLSAIRPYSYWDGKDWYFSENSPEQALFQFKDKMLSAISRTAFEWRGLRTEDGK